MQKVARVKGAEKKERKRASKKFETDNGQKKNQILDYAHAPD